MGNGYYGDFLTWALDESAQEHLFRVWFKEDFDQETCEYYYFSQIIELPDGDILIGMREYDKNEKDKRSTSIYYHKLSEIQFAYVPEDEEDD